MQIEEIEEILIKAYKYRSSFVHSAAQPPHQHPEASMNKFFEVIQNFNSETYETQISPTYELMLGIAKTSMIKWLRTKVKK